LFCLVEDKNFALFNYVNELNNQIEVLQDQIADVKKDIRRFESQGVELEENQQQTVEQLGNKRTQATALSDEYEEKTRAAKKILDQCRAGRKTNSSIACCLIRFSLAIQGIDSLFKKIGCDRRQIDHLLQSHEGVTEDNMLKYLGIIEERTNELLTAQAAITARVKRKFSQFEFEWLYFRNKI